MRISVLGLILVLACRSDEGRMAPADRPVCALPPRVCELGAARCGALVRFAPERGPGYEDVPLAAEVDEHSTSWLRRDLMMLVQYAAAKVACEAARWPGNGGPIALGDMSERDGSIPGTWSGEPRHGAGTHTGGRDIDLGYFQVGTEDNHLRPICPHLRGGEKQYRCVGPPTTLDADRTALFIGALFEEPRVRAVGMDAAAAAPIEAALRRLCAEGWIARAACARARLAYEREDSGRGWYHGHHHHFHVSWGG